MYTQVSTITPINFFNGSRIKPLWQSTLGACLGTLRAIKAVGRAAGRCWLALMRQSPDCRIGGGG